jgi:hypothetical protein
MEYHEGKKTTTALQRRQPIQESFKLFYWLNCCPISAPLVLSVLVEGQFCSTCRQVRVCYVINKLDLVNRLKKVFRSLPAKKHCIRFRTHKSVLGPRGELLPALLGVSHYFHGNIK